MTSLTSPSKLTLRNWLVSRKLYFSSTTSPRSMQTNVPDFPGFQITQLSYKRSLKGASFMTPTGSLKQVARVGWLSHPKMNKHLDIALDLPLVTPLWSLILGPMVISGGTVLSLLNRSDHEPFRSSTTSSLMLREFSFLTAHLRTPLMVVQLFGSLI